MSKVDDIVGQQTFSNELQTVSFINLDRVRLKFRGEKNQTLCPVSNDLLFDFQRF